MIKLLPNLRKNIKLAIKCMKIKYGKCNETKYLQNLISLDKRISSFSLFFKGISFEKLKPTLAAVRSA